MIKKKKNNPNGANQYKLDPRQALFLAYYLDPKSETFSNGLQSALKAGYEEQTAKVLVSQCPNWLSEKLNDASMIDKAEKNLRDMLEMKTEKDGETDSALLKIKQDTTKFVAERLHKNKWAQRQEHTGNQGAPITVKAINYADNHDPV